MERSSRLNPLAGAALALVVLVLNAVLSWYTTRRLVENDRAVSHTHAVLAKIEEVLSTLKDAETGQRGYVITGEPDYLKPYQDAVGRIRQEVGELRELTANNPDQVGHLDALEERITEKLAELQHTIGVRKEKGFDAARAVVTTDRGQRLMDDVRRLTAAMEDAQNDLLKDRQAEAAGSLWTARATNLIGLAAGLGAVGLAYYLLQRDRTEELTRANEGLQLQVQERKRAEAKVQAIADELQRSNRELQEFAAVASHDLQEPLRKIQAFGDRLRSRCGPALGDAGRDYLDRMQAAAVRMANLINDLLAYSRVTTRAQPFTAVDLGQVVQGVLGDLEDRVARTGGRVEVGPLPSLDADPMQMRQLLQNLIGNALKFHRPGAPPVVQVSAEVVEDGQRPGGSCIITVRDNGIGFDEAYREKIFGFFQRLHGRNEYEGSGMGLAICRRIAERHGGTIEARCTPGEGATFSVTLPARQHKEQSADEPASTTDHHPDGR
jgi:signal transduction histidine kinase